MQYNIYMPYAIHMRVSACQSLPNDQLGTAMILLEAIIYAIT